MRPARLCFWILPLSTLSLWGTEHCSASQALDKPPRSTILSSKPSLLSSRNATLTAASSTAGATTEVQGEKKTTTTAAFVPRAHVRGTRDLLKTKKVSSSSPAAAAILKTTKDEGPLIPVDYIADTQLPTDMGSFRMRAYRVRSTSYIKYGKDDDDFSSNNIHGMEPIVIYAADKPPFGRDGNLLEDVPVRIHDQCLTSEVFRSQRYVSVMRGYWVFFTIRVCCSTYFY